MVGPGVTQSKPRYQVVLPVGCQATQQEGRSSPVVFGWTFNLSETGACVELRQPFPRGTALCLTLPFEDASLPLPAHVGWVTYSNAPNGPSVHGLIFLGLTQKQRQGVQTLLQRHEAERERSTRIPARLPVDCRVLATPAPALHGWTGELSPEGCSLLLPEPLPAGTRILVTLTGPRGPQAVAATVAWTAPGTAREMSLHRHGVQFLGTNPAWTQLFGCAVRAVPRPDDPVAATL